MTTTLFPLDATAHVDLSAPGLIVTTDAATVAITPDVLMSQADRAAFWTKLIHRAQTCRDTALKLDAGQDALVPSQREGDR